jgi:hypothetical protein
MSKEEAMKDVSKTVQFVLEIEKLKGVLRKVRPIWEERYENTAEHSKIPGATRFVVEVFHYDSSPHSQKLSPVVHDFALPSSWNSSTVSEDGGFIHEYRATKAGLHICCCSYLRSSDSS